MRQKSFRRVFKLAYELAHWLALKYTHPIGWDCPRISIDSKPHTVIQMKISCTSRNRFHVTAKVDNIFKFFDKPNDVFHSDDWSSRSLSCLCFNGAEKFHTICWNWFSRFYSTHFPISLSPSCHFSVSILSPSGYILSPFRHHYVTISNFVVQQVSKTWTWVNPCCVYWPVHDLKVTFTKHYIIKQYQTL